MRRIIGKKAQSDKAFQVPIDLVIAAIVLVALVAALSGGIGFLGQIIGSAISSQVQKVVNPPSIYTVVSTPNFERLNDELEIILKDDKKASYSVVPYSLGQYRLVGFNRDRSDQVNIACLGEELVKAKEKGPCEDSSCLCLCEKEKSCSCVSYLDVDYFITQDDYRNYRGGLFSGIADPVTGKPTYCLYIKGAESEEEDLKYFDDYDSWYLSANLYLEKVEIGGKTYVFIDDYDDVKYSTRRAKIMEMEKTGRLSETEVPEGEVDIETCTKIQSCMDYKDKDIFEEWNVSCENEVCRGKGNSLSCSVVDNPGAESEEDKKVCLEEGVSITDVCLADEQMGYPYAKKGEFASNLLEPDICMECRGVGGIEANSYGWLEEVDPISCEPEPSAP